MLIPLLCKKKVIGERGISIFLKLLVMISKPRFLIVIAAKYQNDFYNIFVPGLGVVNTLNVIT